MQEVLKVLLSNATILAGSDRTHIFNQVVTALEVAKVVTDDNITLENIREL